MRVHVSFAAAACLGLGACATDAAPPHRSTNVAAETEFSERSVAIGGFTYHPPNPGWSKKLYEPNAAGESHHYRRGGDFLQIQLSTFRPVRPVVSQDEVVAWAKGVAGDGTAWADSHDRGAACARYTHRWNQTLSLGGAPRPVATIEERGLFCIDPSVAGRLIQVRVFSRQEPGAAAPEGFDTLAEGFLSGVRAAP